MKNLYIKTTFGKYTKIAALLLIFLFSGFMGNSQTSQTFQTGSYIVNMGIVPQTIANGLKPYGLVYDLIKNFDVPVYWVIGSAKAKDGIDFTYNGVDYKGGTFVIPKEFITSAVAAKIAAWNVMGVVGAYTTNNLTLTAAYRFTAVPTWTLDAANGSIAQGFLTNAGISLTSFPGAYNWLTPTALGVCNDLFVMPHADPTWATHSNLYNWNLTYKGSIWLGCHAGSALANTYNPANISEQMNFLMSKRPNTGAAGDPVLGSTNYAENSLLLWGSHAGGSIPYNTITNTPPPAPANGTLATAQDPVAQYMGVSDLAQLNGSEQIYLPVLGQGWLPSTKIITYDPSQINIPTLSPGTATLIAYGRAFGDNNRGYVMYEAGHSINKGTAGDVPAQRAFFNWSFLTTVDKVPVVNSITGIPSSNVFMAQPYPQTYPLSVNYSSPVSAGFSSVTWICRKASDGSVIGSFSPNGTLAASSTVFTPPNTSVDIPVIISVRIVDACGRSSFNSYNVTIKACNLVVSNVVTTPASYGNSDGSITWTVSGGTSPYGWSWVRTNPTGGPVSGSGLTIPGLSAGLYSVIVTDASGCTATFSAWIVQPAQLIATPSVTNIKCYGDATGIIGLNVTGGTAPYTYNWTDILGTSDPKDRSGLIAGTYYVTVTDALGVTASAMATVAQPAVGLSLSGIVTGITCFGSANGTIDITASGGTSPYTFNWGGGITTEDRSGLNAGTYNVTVTDANGCTISQSFTVVQPALLSLSTSLTMPSCPPNAQQNGSNGAIDLSVAGGTLAYSYNWTASTGGFVPTGQQSGQDLTGLIAGTYSVTVTDSKGCINSISVILNYLNPNPVQPGVITK